MWNTVWKGKRGINARVLLTLAISVELLYL